jgi:hypothetical protein
VRKLDREVIRHARRPRGQHHHAGAEKHRLADAVGHEHDGLPGLLPDMQQLQVHFLARERVERAKRLVHQDELGIVDERARDGGALLHAAGELIRILFLAAPEPDQGKELARAGTARAHGKPQDLGREQDIVDHASPFQQQWLLEHHADVAARVERMARGPDRQLAGVMPMKARQNLQERGLAATGGADQRDELSRRHIEAYLGDREQIRAPRAVDLLHAGDMDERLGHDLTKAARRSPPAHAPAPARGRRGRRRSA